MYDSVFMRLTQNEVQGVDFLAETPCYLEDVVETIFSDGLVVFTGHLDNLKVIVDRYQVKVKDGSLCKYYMGNNFKTMGRKDTQRAIEKLSDTLHLPMSLAAVTRLDVAQNFCTKHPPEVYLNHLGLLKYASRLQEPDGIYYKQTGGRLAFYDKNREQKNKREPIPELYEGRNVLRYEQRYTNRIARQFGVSEVTSKLLYDNSFYVDVINRWRDTYRQIQKINDVTINYKTMPRIKDLSNFGLLIYSESRGGLENVLTEIKEAQKRGELTNKQAFDHKKAFINAYQSGVGTAPNDAITELDKKVNEAVRLYR